MATGTGHTHDIIERDPFARPRLLAIAIVALVILAATAWWRSGARDDVVVLPGTPSSADDAGSGSLQTLAGRQGMVRATTSFPPALANWQVHVPPGGAFRIRFPTAPDIDTADHPDWGAVTSYRSATEEGVVTLLVIPREGPTRDLDEAAIFERLVDADRREQLAISELVASRQMLQFAAVTWVAGDFARGTTMRRAVVAPAAIYLASYHGVDLVPGKFERFANSLEIAD